eukprot:COSAG04_NODE_3641_length_2648_cov_2.033739_1_plen_812_part_10
MDEALDAADPTAALVEIIVARSCASVASAAGAAARENAELLRSELEGMRLKALKIRAAEAGVGAEAIADADDAEDVKGEVIRLIMGARGPPAAAALAELRSELEGMRLRALKIRAAEAGVDAEAIADADDAEDVKGEVIRLVLEAQEPGQATDGPLLAALRGRGGAAADALTAVLDHALDVLEQLSFSSPRKSRRPILDLTEAVEALCESVDAAWCDGLSACDAAELSALSEQLVSVRGLSADQAAGAGAVTTISDAVSSLRRCGSPAVQCTSSLSSATEADEAARLRVLECVRGLSTDRLECASADESAAFTAVCDHVLGVEGLLSSAERECGLMAAYVLGCRNGLAVTASPALVERCAVDLSSLFEALSTCGAPPADDPVRVVAALSIVWVLLTWESGAKSVPDKRVPLENAIGVGFGSVAGQIGKCFTSDCAENVISALTGLIAEGEQVFLGPGAAFAALWVMAGKAGSAEAAESAGVFRALQQLHGRVCPTPLPTEWWLKTCDVVDAMSVQLTCVWFALSVSRALGQESLEAATWLDAMLKEAVAMAKLNASAGLSARQTMSYFPVATPLQVIEVAARVESHAGSLLDLNVIESLDYACTNNFSFIGTSVSAYAAGALVALVGRNEGGKTLSRSAVNAVLENFPIYFDPTKGPYKLGNDAVVQIARRVATMAISDANKKIMLQHDKLLDTLVIGLLLDDDNHRKGQDGADALQEMSAGVLHELALYGPGASALREHKTTMDALGVLAEVGTKESRESAAGALFELDEEARSANRKASDAQSGSSSKPPPHIMMSYNWDHQDIVLRVVA